MMVPHQEAMAASFKNKATMRVPGHNNQSTMGSLRGLVASDTNRLTESDMYASFPKVESTALHSPRMVYAAPIVVAPNIREYRVADVHNPVSSRQYELPYHNDHHHTQQQPEQVSQQQQQRYRDVARSIGLARPEGWGVAMEHIWSRRSPPTLPPLMCSNSHLPLATTSSPPPASQQQHHHHPQQPIVAPQQQSPVPFYTNDHQPSSSVESITGTLATSTHEIQAPLPQQPTTSVASSFSSSVITPRKDVGVIARPTWSQITSGVKALSTNDAATTTTSRPIAPIPATSHSLKPASVVRRKFNRPSLVPKDSSATTTTTTPVPSQSDKTNGTERGSQLVSKGPRVDNSMKLLSESLSYLCDNPLSYTTSNRYPVIRLSNIPWTISIKEIEAIFKNVKFPDPKDHAQSIHIIINKTTGKTQSDAFVEVATEKEAERAVKHYRNLPVKGRKLFIEHSSYEEMMKKLFPDWPGTFVDGKAVYDPSDMASVTSSSSNQSPPLLLPRREIENLLGVCKNFKVHFSRKCGERPFENFISILVRFPWDQPNLITTMQRDHLYEYYKLATSVLKTHMEKPYVNLDRDLVFRMIRAALQCPGFTVPQKRGILAAANVPCPPQLQAYIEMPSTPTPPEEA